MVTKIKNPRVEVKVYSDETITINDRAEDVDDDLHVDVEIEKTLKEDPNDATITIYNLNESYRKKLSDSSDQYAPIEVYMTPGGEPEKFVLAFNGEIDTVKNRFLNPGHETVIHCTSQQENHRSLPFSKTYKKGTKISAIVSDMVNAVNLPKGNIADIPNTEILISESFSGPAFPLLQRYVFDMGMYCYITDGRLSITDSEEIQNPTITSINPDFFTSDPEQTSRVDKAAIAQKTVTESRNVNSFAKQPRRKKRTKTTKIIGENDYTSYDAIDKTIEGIEITHLLLPALNPDDIFPYNDKLYRVKQVYHFASNGFSGPWETDIEADIYEDQSGDLRTRIEAEKGFLVDVPASELRGQS